MNQDQASPANTAQAVIDALNAQDWRQLFAQFAAANVEAGAKAFEGKSGPDAKFPYFELKVKEVSIHGSTATGYFQVVLSDPAGLADPLETEEEVHFHLSEDGWKILTTNSNTSFFGQFALIALNRQDNLPRRQAKTAASLSKLKRISLAILKLASAESDLFNLDQSTLREKLQPYLLNGEIWLDQEGSSIDIRLNPSLIGRQKSEVASPKSTVLLSVGPQECLTIFDDATPIAFVDGHVEWVASNDVPNLSWSLS